MTACLPALLRVFGWMPAWRRASRSHLRRYMRASLLLRPMRNARCSPILGSSGHRKEPCTMPAEALAARETTTSVSMMSRCMCVPVLLVYMRDAG